MIILILLLPLLLIVGLWVYGFIQANDFSVPTKSFGDFKPNNILVIFPHPDDEAQSLSGTITQFVKNKAVVNWIVLTRGERGTSDAHVEENIGQIRTKESENVAKVLNINAPVFGDFPDSGMVDHKDELSTYLKQQISKYKPDLIITYDESGGYGHPDHIIVSQVVTSLLKTDFPDVHLWYTSTPEKLFKQLSLPTQMAKDQEYLKSRKSPSFKVWVGMSGIMSKIQAVYAYKSQFDSFVKGVPIKQIPLWFYVSLTPYEYFYEVK